MPTVGSSTTPTAISCPDSRTRNCSRFSSFSSGVRPVAAIRQQKVAPIGVQSDMLIKCGRLGRQQAIVPLARVRNRAAAEIERSPRSVKHDFDASRDLRVGRGGGSGSPSVAITAWVSRVEQIDHQIDRRTRQFGLVALHVDQNDRRSGNCRATSATRSVPLAQSGLVIRTSPPKRPHRVGDFLMVGGHANAGRLNGPPGRLVRVLNKRLAGLAEQQLAWQPSGSQAGRNDQITDAAGLPDRLRRSFCAASLRDGS